MTPEVLDRVAKRIRLAFAESDPHVSTSYFIKDNPWETLADGRKTKWRAMARAALEVLTYETYSNPLLKTGEDAATFIQAFDKRMAELEEEGK
jgi:hypothetical protein